MRDIYAAKITNGKFGLVMEHPYPSFKYKPCIHTYPLSALNGIIVGQVVMWVKLNQIDKKNQIKSDEIKK